MSGVTQVFYEGLKLCLGTEKASYQGHYGNKSKKSFIINTNCFKSNLEVITSWKLRITDSHYAATDNISQIHYKWNTKMFVKHLLLFFFCLFHVQADIMWT